MNHPAPACFPSLFQANTRVWLTDIGRKLGRPATLDDIPDVELDRLAEAGFDWVWFLSVWQTGAAGRESSRNKSGVAEGISGDASRFARGRHRRIRFCNHWLHRRRKSRRRRGAGPAAKTASSARPEADARFRAQPHGAGSSVGGNASRILHPRFGTGSGPRADELHLGQARARRFAARPRTRPVFSRLAGHAAIELRQSRHAGGHGRRVVENRRPVRRRALRHGHARAAGSV